MRSNLVQCNPVPDQTQYFTLFGGLTFSSFLGTLVLLRHCGIFLSVWHAGQGEACNFYFYLGWKSETCGKKYNLVANTFFSWVSFLKKILRDSDKFSGEPELCWWGTGTVVAALCSMGISTVLSVVVILNSTSGIPLMSLETAVSLSNPLPQPTEPDPRNAWVWVHSIDRTRKIGVRW